MQAFFLKKYGSAAEAFELKEVAEAFPKEQEVRIDVEAFGLNFADVMARRGMYKEAPPLPCVIGYEVCGKISAVGKGVDSGQLGKRVIAFTRFGGYSQQIITPLLATVEIPENWEPGKATALATQYSTAWYASMIATTMREGDAVLINSAAGGVGTALMQIAVWKKCRICGTTVN